VIVIDLEAYAPPNKINDEQRRHHKIWEFAASNMSGTFEFTRIIRADEGLSESDEMSLYPWKNARARGISLKDNSLDTFDVVWSEFVAHLNSLDINPVFIAHNGFKHDFRVLKTEFQRYWSAVPDLKILDSILLFERIFNSNSYAMEELYQSTFGGKLPRSHEAISDVRGLVKLLSVFIGHMAYDYKGFSKDCVALSHSLVLLGSSSTPTSATSESSSGSISSSSKKKYPSPERCPACGDGKLTERLNRWDETWFLGCSNFPDCEYTKNL